MYIYICLYMYMEQYSRANFRGSPRISESISISLGISGDPWESMERFLGINEE